MTGKFLATIGLVAAALAGASIEPIRVRDAAVPMTADDGKSYLVEPQETLGDAMTRASVLPEEEKGHCVPEPLENKPPGSVPCKCYEVTECKGNEARSCKRHCRKDLCECCAI